MSEAWAERQREFQARVVVGSESDEVPIGVVEFASWELADTGDGPRPRAWLWPMVGQFVAIGFVSVALGLAVGLVAGPETGATTGLAMFVAVGMTRMFAGILREHRPAGVRLGAGCYVALAAADGIVVVPVVCRDRGLLGDEGMVTVVGWCAPGATLGFVVGESMVWPAGPPLSA